MCARGPLRTSLNLSMRGRPQWLRAALKSRVKKNLDEFLSNAGYAWYIAPALVLAAFFLCPYPNRATRILRKTAMTSGYVLQDLGYILLFHIDWIYWCMLFVPFYAMYVCVREKMYMLKTHLMILERDVTGKNRFIEWQNVALIQLDSRMLDLRKEMETLRRCNEILQREEEGWRKARDMMKKRIREQQKVISSTGRPIVRREILRQEITAVVKKNKSEGTIKSKESNGEKESSESSQIKTSPSHRSLPIMADAKKNSGQEWEKARLRLLARSKFLRNRSNSQLQPEEGGEKKTLSKAACFSTVSDSTTDQDISQTTLSMPRHCDLAACLSTVSETETEDNSIMQTLQNHRIPKANLNKTSSDGSLAVEPSHERIHHSRSSEPLNEEYGMTDFKTNVRSYTEVFKKKVHVPSCGSAPRITIEGQRRWCF